MTMKINGLDLDRAGRCRHYHSELDIVVLKCEICQKYYACYQCHDSLENHPFQANDIESDKPVLCGNCMTCLSFSEYQVGTCSNCLHRFNPNCKKHHSIYFKGD